MGSTTSLPGSARLASALYAAAACGAVVGLGILRSFHEETPGLFPGPFGSLLFVALAATTALWLVRRPRRGGPVVPPAPGPRLTLVVVLPLLIAIVSEKWVSVELLAYAYDWTDEYLADAALASAAYVSWTGLTLLGVSLVLLVSFRDLRRRARRLVLPRRIPAALAIFAAAAAITMGLAVLVSLAAGPLRFGIRNLPTSVLLATAGAQVLRSAAEELFYRGILQTSLKRLLERAGVAPGRPSQVLAIVVVSAGFALEHVDPSQPPRIAIGMVAYVFAMSCALGAILETSRNLYLAAFAHASVNLLLDLLVPLPMTAGTPFPPPEILVMWLVVLVFSGIAVGYRARAMR